MSKRHIAIYGEIKMLRVYCDKCKQNALVVNGIKQCCEKPIEEKMTKKFEVVVAPLNKRKRPSRKRQREIIEFQNHKCLYCGKEFGTPYWYKGKVKSTTIHFDHHIPFSYTQTNKDTDFVGLCNICNGLKSNKMFSTVKEVFYYVEYHRKKKGYEYAEDGEMPSM